MEASFPNTIQSIEQLTKTFSQNYTQVQWESVLKSYHLAKEAHEGQFRRSGKPYITHPIGVAAILCSLKMDSSTIITALLHDTVEDTDMTLEEVKKNFDTTICDLVDGVTKISKIKFHNSHEKQSENIRKLIISMGKDVRVILVKLADRLHNMREMLFLPAPKQKRISEETLDIYVPLALRLGINSIQVELEDLCFKYLYPKHYANLLEKTRSGKSSRDKIIKNSILKVEEKLKENVTYPFKVDGRSKNLFSIYKKMQRKNLSFEQIHDTLALRICVETVSQCYEVLGFIHALWKPIHGRFKDFIALPKSNGYKSLHTTVIGPEAERMEVQLRTYEMHRISEYGVAAHWLYKEDKEINKDYVDNFAGLRSLVGYHAGSSSFSDEFLEGMKVDLLEGEIYVFTPKGEVKEFPEGATLIDFAYFIHTDLGDHLDHGVVDGSVVPIDYEFKSGDIIFVKTDEKVAPSKTWLNHCVTSRAKTAIRHFIRGQERHEYRELGRILISQHFANQGRDFRSDFLKEKAWEKISRHFEVKNEFDFFVALGFGRIDMEEAFFLLNPELKRVEKDSKSDLEENLSFENSSGLEEFAHRIFVTGSSASLTHLESCCRPVPGDPIVGYWGADRSIKVHHAKCRSIYSHLPENRVRVEWGVEADQRNSYSVQLKVICEDSSGLLKSMSEAFSRNKINITNLDIQYLSDLKVTCIFSIKVSHVDQVYSVTEDIRSIDRIISAERL